MHERKLVTDLIDQIESVAAREKADRVVRVRAWIGALSHLTAVSLRTSFEQHAADGVAAGATLDVTVSKDIHHPDARGIILQSIDVADGN
ncbi:MAG: hydrogenase maturation nickel metallochaperone HypA [Gammaproteobacteria bacterium]|nr:hydrogenase maturation nickel metallochaperone HypA [Gammaproteobacteria bacterium]